MSLPDGTPATIQHEERERVDAIILRRAPADDPVQEPIVIKVVTVLRDDVPSNVKSYRLSDAERTALWNSVATLTFKNWILNQVIPSAND